MLFSFFHNFVKLKLVILFSRLISFFPIFNRVYEKLQKLPIDPTPTPPPPPRLPVLQLPVTVGRSTSWGARRGWEMRGGCRYRRGYVVGWVWVRWGELRWGGGGGGRYVRKSECKHFEMIMELILIRKFPSQRLSSPSSRISFK